MRDDQPGFSRVGHGLPSGARLRSATEFRRLREKGRAAHGRWMVLRAARASGEEGLSRVGVITSRRVGGAVVRSGARRRLRELFRLGRHDIREGVWVVMIAKRGIERASWSELREEWLRLGRRLSILAPLSAVDEGRSARKGETEDEPPSS